MVLPHETASVDRLILKTVPRLEGPLPRWLPHMAVSRRPQLPHGAPPLIAALPHPPPPTPSE